MTLLLNSKRSASSGLPLTYTVVSGPASLKAGTTDTIKLDGTEGNVTIKATQAGNDAYNAATAVTQAFFVNDREVQSLTFKGKGEDGSGLRILSFWVVVHSCCHWQVSLVVHPVAL